MSDDPRLDKTAALFNVLANPTRMRIVELLGQHGELNVTKVVNELKLDQSLLSHYLIRMSVLGMIVSRRQGREVWYSLADPALSEVVTLMLR